MVAQPRRPSTTKREWAEKRAKIRNQLRRSSEISDGAFRLWDELATGWAWNDPNCFPTYDVLAEALNRHRNTISRLMAELVEHGLVERRRKKRGYEFVLATDVPIEVLESGVMSNRDISKTVKARKSKKRVPGQVDEIHQNQCITEQNSESRCTDPVRHDAPKPVHDPCCDAPNLVDGDAPKPVRVDDEVGTREAVQREEKQKKGKKKRKPAVSASRNQGGMSSSPSRFALGDEGTEADGEMGTYNHSDDLEGLIENPWGEKPRRNPRKKRGADKSLVPGAGRVEIPFPEAQRGSQSLDHTKFDSRTTPPPVERSQDVLELLRDEVEEKWGRQAGETIPMELTGKLSGQIKNTLLTKFPPNVILAMIRLLVWDWEVARGVCFPFRHEQKYPDPLTLVQYARELASRIDSGFSYPTQHRGKENTYHSIYLEKNDRVDYSDPW